MLNTESPDQLVPVWKALSDGTRRRILDLLHERPMTTGAIAGSFEISRIAVMKHLAVLQGAGLILSQKQGRERWHHLNCPAIGDRGSALRVATSRLNVASIAPASASTCTAPYAVSAVGAGAPQSQKHASS